LALGAPAHGQYIFMDVNNNGACSSTDVLTSSITAVDVWMYTDHNKNGTVATCTPDPSKNLDMLTYSVILHASGNGTVTFTGWTNAMANFTNIVPFRAAGADMGIAYADQPPGSFVNPGLYKLGTANVTVTGNPVLSFLDLAPDPSFTDFTGFGSHCPGSSFAFSEVLNFDFFDNCGTSPTTPTESTTWGRIKQLYK